MSEHELRQKHFQTEQLLDTKLNIVTFLQEMVQHVEFDITHLLQEQHRLERQLSRTVREAS
jgi:hypothetical protein